MDETPRMDPPPPQGGSVRKKTGKGVLWGLLAVVVAFLIGFGWQWYEAGTVRDELARTEQELHVERLRVQLAEAAMAAQSGDYETARQQMSDFFTRLQERRASLPAALSDEAGRFLEQRDDVITGLSRSNPAYAGVLYRMLGSFSDATAGETAAPAGPAPASGVADTPGGEPTAVPAGADTSEGGPSGDR